MMAIETFNGSQPWEILTYIDSVTGYWAGKFLLIIIFLTMYITLGNLSNNRAFAAATFVTNIIAILFFFLGIIQVGTLYICFDALLLDIIIIGSEGK